MAGKSKLNTKVFLRLLTFAKPYRSILLVALFSVIVLGFISAARPYVIGEVVKRSLVDDLLPDLLLKGTLLVVGMLIMEAILQFLGAYFSNLLAQNIIRDLRKKLFRHIVSFKMQYFDQTPIGALVTRVVSDLEAVSEVFSAGLIAIVGDVLMLSMVITGMVLTDAKLTLLSLLPIPLLIIATRIFAKVVRKAYQLEQQQVTRLNTFVQERISGMAIVQLFNREKVEYDRFVEINKGHRKAHINAVWAYSIFFPVVEIFSSISIALLLVWVAFQVGGDGLENPKDAYDEILKFTFWIHMLYRPIRQLADKFNILQRGTVRAERVIAILDKDDHIQDFGSNTEVDFAKDISFQNVDFSYIEGSPVLKKINLDIKAGSTVAFVGATGAGKSSIVNLIGRFYEYQSGQINLGEVDLKSIDLHYLRSNISIVLQDVFLFSDTIHNNITLGDTSISRDEVIAAAKAVNAHDFIQKLEGGYDYEVGERGGVLSVGQRQLISFIRAYVFKPSILILDEATSSVDDQSEELIQNATEKLTKGRTSIVIAHRLSTIQSADQIVVLEKGEIVEKGTHSELLEVNGNYRRLYDMQFSEEEK